MSAPEQRHHRPFSFAHPHLFRAPAHPPNPPPRSTAGLFGYAHITGGYEGGQADYVRVPFGECIGYGLRTGYVLRRLLAGDTALGSARGGRTCALGFSCTCPQPRCTLACSCMRTPAVR